MQTIRAASTLALFLGLAFAGCIGGDDGEPAATSPSGSVTVTNPPPGTSASPTPTETEPPSPEVEVEANGTTLERVNASYEVPAGENVTLDATATEDPDGGEVSFAWDFGDGNTSEEPAPVHAWAKAGNYTVSLEVTDDEGDTATTELPFTVETTRPAPGTFLRNETKRFTGTVTVGTQGPSGCGLQGSLDTVTRTWTIPGVDNNTTAPILVTKFKMVIVSQGSTGVDVDYYFYDPAGKEIGHSAGFEPLDGKEKGFEKEGEFAPGNYKVVVRGCTGAQMSFTVDMTATMVAA